MNVKLRRLIAFIIDFYISILPPTFIFTFLSTFLQSEALITIILFLTIIFALGAFIARDVIFKGRSLGKRILALYVYDKNSLTQASKKQCFLRNIFLCIYLVDGIILLATEKTIGDRVAGTLVTSKQGLDSYTNKIQDSFPTPKQKKVTKVVLVIAIIIVALAIFSGLIQTVLNAQKDTEEYKVAYSYFVKSQAFKELNADESKIRFNKYSSSTHTSKDSDSITQTIKIGFVVNFQSFEVICHKENNVWQVCDKCTLFE